MNCLMVRVLAAFLAFTGGLIAAKLISYQRSEGRCQQPVKVETNKTPEASLSPQTITFHGDGIVSAFQPHYHSSDGVHLRYGCFEYASRSDVARGLRDEVLGRHVIERTPKLNAKGDRIGERVVIATSTTSETGATIVWTEGSRLFLLRAPLLSYALLFEKSQAWAGDKYCVNVGAWPRR